MSFSKLVKNGQTSLKLWPFFITSIFWYACSGPECVDCIYRGTDKSFAFNSEYINMNKKDTIFYSITMKTGNAFFLMQNKLQYEVIKYESHKKQKSKFRSESTTGFKENDGRIWLHPPRTDQFKRITQLAPYPQLYLPYKSGDEYEGNITMANNWGDWNGKKSSYRLTIDSTNITALNDTIVFLSGVGTLENDTCEVKYLFSTRVGFFQWHYNWNDTVKFDMNLIEPLVNVN